MDRRFIYKALSFVVTDSNEKNYEDYHTRLLDANSMDYVANHLPVYEDFEYSSVTDVLDYIELLAKSFSDVYQEAYDAGFLNAVIGDSEKLIFEATSSNREDGNNNTITIYYVEDDKEKTNILLDKDKIQDVIDELEYWKSKL